MAYFKFDTVNPAERHIDALANKVYAWEQAYNEERRWEQEEALRQYQGLSFDRGSVSIEAL